MFLRIFCGTDFTQRLGINVPPAFDRTPSSISCKRFLNPEAVPTVDDHDIALQTFPQTTTPVPMTPQVPEPSKLRAKRRLLREATSSQSNTRAKVHKTAEKNADDNICIHDEFESTLLIESPSVFPPKEISASNTTEHSHELKKCKEKLKAAQQKSSNYRKTIKRLQLKLKTNTNANGSNADEHCKYGCLEESGVNDMCSTNQQVKTDDNVNVDPDEIDEYLVETDEMNDIEDLKNYPNWENLECEV